MEKKPEKKPRVSAAPEEEIKGEGGRDESHGPRFTWQGTQSASAQGKQGGKSEQGACAVNKTKPA